MITIKEIVLLESKFDFIPSQLKRSSNNSFIYNVTDDIRIKIEFHFFEVVEHSYIVGNIYNNSQTIGKAQFDFVEKDRHGDEVYAAKFLSGIDNKFQRLGLMTILYKWVQYLGKHLVGGFYIVESRDDMWIGHTGTTSEGHALWNSLRKDNLFKENIIKEIGEGNIEPYQFQINFNKNFNEYKAEFTTINNEKYIVDILLDDNTMLVTFHVKGQGLLSTNRNEQYKIMSTVSNTVFKVLKKESNINKIKFSPESHSKKNTKIDKGESRGNLYLAFIKKQISKIGKSIVNIEKDNNYWTVEFN